MIATFIIAFIFSGLHVNIFVLESHLSLFYSLKHSDEDALEAVESSQFSGLSSQGHGGASGNCQNIYVQNFVPGDLIEIETIYVFVRTKAWWTYTQ